MWRHVASNALTFFVVVLFLVGGLITWGVGQYRAEGPLDAAICLNVPSNSSMRSVSAELAAQGAVTSPTVFRIGVDYEDIGGQLKAGNFLIPAGASMEAIAAEITGTGASTCGTRVVYRVGVARTVAEVQSLDPATGSFTETAEFVPGEGEPPAEYLEAREAADTTFEFDVVPGVTSWQVVQAMGAIDLFEGTVPEVPAEGSLAPRAYEIEPGTDPAALLAEMEERQAAILATAWENRAEGLPIETPEEALILASIVEKETGVPDERPQVASVFVNRLEQGMRLQTDPTVIYGITNGEGVLGRGLRASELRAATPYNTYVIAGLPPTPIANPSREAIEAALNPATTDFIFFVADGTGGHAFATNLEDHNRNVAVWREIEAEQAAAAEAEASDG
ncbi:endolytic transglycosylase MltG [Wenxinia marina]|uniref:Endolytic murein transglycosylase n=1 Tax=Wenxinia marina DSM 24838 TaxID=1123501 RepID=A0A0D0NNS8_9RHOB|nr:endolytic transglycosylase MltG [Wenxinia marina]KIQ69945.1 conserved hypothetical protein, YceG family [Wenxinia marina DSM 24838]GGL62357.1 branched-chain alpha-keto acid dehydrogenase subunit E2 [Wenxinia marina]